MIGDVGRTGEGRMKERKELGRTGEGRMQDLKDKGRKNCRSRMLGGGDMIVEQFQSNHLTHLTSCIIVLGFRSVFVLKCVIFSRSRIVQVSICCRMTRNEPGVEEQQFDDYDMTDDCDMTTYETGDEEQQFENCKVENFHLSCLCV